MVAPRPLLLFPVEAAAAAAGRWGSDGVGI